MSVGIYSYHHGNDDDDDGDDDDADAKEEDDDIEEEEAIPRGISILLPTADYWSKCTKNAPWKFELITSNDDEEDDDEEDGNEDEEDSPNDRQPEQVHEECTFELITSNDYHDHHFDDYNCLEDQYATYQEPDDHDDHRHEGRDDGPWKRPGQAKSHIKFSFIALVTCDTHRNMWHTGALSAESPTVAVSTTCIRWHQVQNKCTWLSLKCKILLLPTLIWKIFYFKLAPDSFFDQDSRAYQLVLVLSS